MFKYVFLPSSVLLDWANGYGLELQLQNDSFTHSASAVFLLGSEESYFRRFDQTGERGWP